MVSESLIVVGEKGIRSILIHIGIFSDVTRYDEIPYCIMLSILSQPVHNANSC